MASELSRLIDDELEKVERQQEASDGKRSRTSFQIKGPDKPRAAASWRDLSWWTKNRIILASAIALLVLLALWLSFSKPSRTTEAEHLQSPGKNEPQSTFSDKTVEGTIAGILAPSYNASGPAPSPLLGNLSTSSILSSSAPSPGPQAFSPEQVGNNLGPDFAPSEGQAPENLSPELAKSPSTNLSSEAPSPSPQINDTEPLGGRVEIRESPGRKLGGRFAWTTEGMVS